VTGQQFTLSNNLGRVSEASLLINNDFGIGTGPSLLNIDDIIASNVNFKLI